MKTGFENAFANKSLNKYYYYHGILTPCEKQIEPKPYKEYPTTGGAVWVLVIDVWPVIPYYFYECKVADLHTLPSSQDNICPGYPFPDNKKRYWYTKIDYYTARPDNLYMWLLESGKECNTPLYYGYSSYIYIEMLEEVHTASYIFILEWPKSPTHVRVWVSSTGELPAGTP